MVVTNDNDDGDGDGGGDADDVGDGVTQPNTPKQPETQEKV